jgi:putative hydrolase of the HAD superfamily
VADALRTRFDRRRIAELIEADIAGWSAVDDTMVALVEELVASGRRIALLSNIPEELAVHYETRHRWLQHFQIRAFSCRTGAGAGKACRSRRVPCPGPSGRRPW